MKGGGRRRTAAKGGEGAAQRIISLLPSATEIVCALGLEDRLVGISHSCDYPPEVNGLPRLSRPRTDLTGMSSAEIDASVRAALRDHGSVYEIDLPAIAELAPDLILTQGICDVCAVPESQVVAALERESSQPFKGSDSPSPPFRVGRTQGTQILTLDAHDINAILTGIRDVGCATGAAPQAEQCIAEIQDRIERVRERIAGKPKPRVLALEWLDPPYVPGHWVPEMVALAGGELVLGEPRRPSYRVEWSDLRAADPDIVVIMPCGFGLDEATRELTRYEGKIREIAPRACAAGRVYPVDASAYFSRSGPRFVEGLEILHQLLFPL